MFMQINHPTTLTPDDHAVLERLMCTLSGSQEPIATLVRRKLETAVIVHPEAATDGLVTSDRQVRYCVNGVVEAEHRLTWDQPQAGDASAISLQQPLGLALLGLRTGQSISFPAEAGIETAEVTGVSAVPGTSSGPARGQSPIITSKLRLVAAAIKRQARSTLARLQKGRTEATLMRLSDATLKDIGITRGEIPHVADIVAGLTPAPTISRPRPDGPVDKARRSGRPETAQRPAGRPQPFARTENTPARLSPGR